MIFHWNYWHKHLKLSSEMCLNLMNTHSISRKCDWLHHTLIAFGTTTTNLLMLNWSIYLINTVINDYCVCGVANSGHNENWSCYFYNWLLIGHLFDWSIGQSINWMLFFYKWNRHMFHACRTVIETSNKACAKRPLNLILIWVIYFYHSSVWSIEWNAFNRKLPIDDNIKTVAQLLKFNQ